jgi:hypothetical protein
MILISKPLLKEASAENEAVATDLRRLGTVETTHHIQWNEGVNSGEVVIEAGPSADYTGAWDNVATVTFDGSVTPAPKSTYVRAGGSYGAMRHRISLIVEDGTVTTKIVGS